MKRLIEILVFVVLAAGVHLAFALQWSDGSGFGGNGGSDLMSLEAASASVETMVAHWEKPPTVAGDSPVLEPQVQPDTPPPSVVATTAPDLPVLRTAALMLPSAARRDAPSMALDLVSPAAMVAPAVTQPQRPQSPVAAAPAVRPELRPTPRPDTPDRPDLQPTRPDAAPTAETKPPEPPAPKQAKRPPAAAKPAQSASKSSAPQAKLRAAGNTGGSQAGASGKASPPTLSKGNKARLVTVWRSQVQARIARRMVRPRGRVGGTVHLKLSVARDGRVLSVQVIKSSGVAAVDKAALSSVARAGRMPKAPKGLNDPSYGFRVPMVFD